MSAHDARQSDHQRAIDATGEHSDVDGGTIALAAGPWRLELLPRLGGRIASLRWRHPEGGWLDLLAPMKGRDDHGEDAGCFPLTPFSNRLRHGRFTFAGRSVSMPLNTPGPHVEHGHGWQRPWRVAAIGPDTARLAYDHTPDAWPYPYVATQEFSLRPDRLDVSLTILNHGPDPMPIGFGLHPYFPATPLATLEAAPSWGWEVDAEVMPVRRVATADLWGPSPRMAVASRSLDNAFGGWNGIAEIRWPERAAGLRMTADAPLRHLVVYTPPGADHFCAEPVSNCTDAFNLALGPEETGLIVLAPSTQCSATVSFSPFVLSGS